MRVSTKSDEIGGIKTAKFIAASHVLALAHALCDGEEFEEAKRVLLEEMRNAGGDDFLAAVVLFGRTEFLAGNYRASARALVEHYRLAEESSDLQLRAWFHATLAGAYLQLKLLSEAEFEHTLASRFFTQINDFDVVGCTENNLGYIAGQLGRVEEAREHFANARSLLAAHPLKLADVDDTEAQVNMIEGNWREAARLACRAHLVAIEHGDERLVRATRLTLNAATYADAVAGRASEDCGTRGGIAL